jgi:aquaporin Z
MDGAMKKYLAELIGTAVLVFVGCGAVIFSQFGGALPIGILPIGLAFGLAVTAMAYTVGPISGCHINPAVTVAMLVAGRMKQSEAIGYIIAQFIGGIVGAAVLYVVASGKTGGYDIAQGGHGQTTFSNFSVLSAILAELIGTLIFTAVILGVTQSQGGSPAVAGLIIGLTLMILHLVFVPVTGNSLNPARSLGPALFTGGQALAQIWLYIIIPPIGGAIAGWLFRARILSA